MRDVPTRVEEFGWVQVGVEGGEDSGDVNASNENGGTLRHYNGTVLRTGVYDTWINLKVAHNAGTGRIQAYVDDGLVTTVDDRGPATRHFKNGVYHHGDGRAEARFRNLRYWPR